MTDEGWNQLKTLAGRLAEATPERIAEVGVDKFLDYCGAVQQRLITSQRGGRLQLATLVGLKANLVRAKPHERTDQEILSMVREVFPNATIIPSAGNKLASIAHTATKEREEPRSPADSIDNPKQEKTARAAVKREGKPRDTPRHPVLTERQMELGRSVINPMGALPIPGQNPNDPDDQPW